MSCLGLLPWQHRGCLSLAHSRKRSQSGRLTRAICLVATISLLDKGCKEGAASGEKLLVCSCRQKCTLYHRLMCLSTCEGVQLRMCCLHILSIRFADFVCEALSSSLIESCCRVRGLQMYVCGVCAYWTPCTISILATRSLFHQCGHQQHRLDLYTSMPGIQSTPSQTDVQQLDSACQP